MSQAYAWCKYQRISAQKVRPIARYVTGLPVEKAIDALTGASKIAAKLVSKVLASAIANAENNHGMDVDELYIKEIHVDEGPTLKRWKARAKGRSNRILKRSCHVKVIVSEKES
jgi:large subunit ribosomal protein L22